MTNFDLAAHVFLFLQQTGVESLVVCAGARNAALVLALQKQNFKIYSFFEERSAAFFALGLIKATQKPVAVITTSGTAAAELLPAAVESFYQGLPLILVTADRPKNYRGRGSPQTIEQVGLFSHYVECVYDLDVQTQDFNFKWGQKKPIHLNVAFDEPLIDLPSSKSVLVNLEKPVVPSVFKNQKSKDQNPLIILGEIPQEYKSQVIEFLVKTKAPVYAEPLSQLKCNSEIKNYALQSSEALIKQIFKMKLCDSVIRIGGVPTLRFWRDLEHEFRDLPVMNYTHLPFSGLSRGSIQAEISQLEADSEFSADKLRQIKESDLELQRIKAQLLAQYPLSEQNLTKQLSDIVSTQALYLGNSLPIRNWDQFGACNSEVINANRGANGIDGQVSTYLGWSESFSKSFCYIGDLTAMYDLAALGLRAQLNKNQRNIIVLNNFGGQIFNRVFKNSNLINAHTIKFDHWARMWNWDYLQISDLAALQKINTLKTEFNIIEVLPHPEQTQSFWNEWEALF